MLRQTGPKLDRDGKEMVKRLLAEGRTYRYVNAELKRRGLPELSDQALWNWRNKPDVQALRAAMRQRAETEQLADLWLLVQTITDNYWICHWRMRGIEPDPDCPEHPVDAQAKTVLPKDFVRYSEQARKWARELTRLLYPTGARTSAKTASSGNPADENGGLYQSEAHFRACVENYVNDMMERAVAEREGIAIEEVRKRVEARIALKQIEGPTIDVTQ